MIISTLAVFQAWTWLGVGIGKFLFDYVLKTFSPQKLNVLGANLNLAGYLLYCVSKSE